MKKLTTRKRDEYLLYLDDQKRGCVREDRKYYEDEIERVENLKDPDVNEFDLFSRQIN